MEERTCTKCNETKKLNQDNFYLTNCKDIKFMRECKVCTRLRASTTFRFRRFGITNTQYSNMLDVQNNVCAICFQKSRDGRVLCVDHDHKTGKIRGLLCNECNRGIGQFDDDITKLQSAIKYLEQNAAKE